MTTKKEIKKKERKKIKKKEDKKSSFIGFACLPC
jgi:hypothetical protein